VLFRSNIRHHLMQSEDDDLHCRVTLCHVDNSLISTLTADDCVDHELITGVSQCFSVSADECSKKLPITFALSGEIANVRKMIFNCLITYLSGVLLLPTGFRRYIIYGNTYDYCYKNFVI